MEPNILKKLIQDISNLKSGTVKILLLTSAVAALGIYTPMFTMVSFTLFLSLSLIEIVSFAKVFKCCQRGIGYPGIGTFTNHAGHVNHTGSGFGGGVNKKTFCATQFRSINTYSIAGNLKHFFFEFCLADENFLFFYLFFFFFQFFLATVALSILFMSFIMGYKGLCILSGIYGVGFGGFRFSLKMLALERIKMKFSKTWSFVRGIEAIPVLISVPLTIFLNDYSLKYGRAGYYICSAAAAIAAIIIFFIGYSNYPNTSSQRSTMNGAVIPATPRMRSMSTQYVRNKYQPAFTVDYTKNNGCDYQAPDLLNRSCISLNQLGASTSCMCETMRSICSCQHHQHHHHLTPSQPRRHFMTETNRTTAATGGASSLHAAGVGHEHSNPYMYDNGTGNYLRRSLSFIQNANCCGANQFQLQCQANVQWSNRDLR